ncbi:MAG: 23S rRNA pseudouridine(955/2504/2580) synthase RluC [Gammaproteobacteria bacterium]
MSQPAPKPAAVRVVEVASEDADQRIDNFLMRHLKGVPRSRIYRILRRGEVRVNGRRTGPDYRICAGDKVRIPPVRTAAGGGGPAPVRPGLEAAILYEDDRYLVLDKPSGLAVHGGSGVSHGVIEALRALRPQARFLELAHRLDRETSGCLLVAKRRSALRAVHELLRGGGVEKRYLALVQGAWQGGPRQVNAPLRKNQLRSGERMVRVDPTGKSAQTWFRPVTVYGQATLVEAHLGTGRTHQIRVHAAHSGHPIAGDEKYGDEGFNRAMRSLGLRRLFLHAQSLAFTEPDSDREIHVSAPLAPDLRAVLDALEQVRAPAPTHSEARGGR